MRGSNINNSPQSHGETEGSRPSSRPQSHKETESFRVSVRTERVTTEAKRNSGFSTSLELTIISKTQKKTWSL